MKIALLAAGAMASGLAHAQPLLCEPEGAEPFILAQITDDGTLVTPEGARVKLAGILWPDRLEPQRRQSLQSHLRSSLSGETLTFKPAGPPDRWGIRPAYLFVREKGGSSAPFWLQGGLVEAGLTPAWPELPDLCWHRLIDHEKLARQARRGYWAPRAQAARHARMYQAPKEQTGRKIVARWRVFSTRKSQVLTYVNITPFFRVGPSLGLTSRQVETLAKQGVLLESLKGRIIVVRFISGATGLLRARLAQGDALMPE